MEKDTKKKTDEAIIFVAENHNEVEGKTSRCKAIPHDNRLHIISEKADKNDSTKR